MKTGLVPRFGAWRITTCFYVLLQVVINAIDPCQVSQNYTDPAGVPTKSGVRQNTAGCRGSSSGDFEVHVLGDYGNKIDEIPKTSQVNIRGSSNSPFILVLVNPGEMNWKIESHQDVPLAVVLLMSNSSHTTVDFSKARNTTDVAVEKAKPPAGAESLENANQLVNHLSNKFLTITSFSGADTVDKWVLQLSHFKEPAPTVTASTSTTEDPVIAAPNECLQDVDCWLHYNFTYDDNWNDCHGEQYVTRTKFSVGKYVGVVLCSASRYKLFMADSLEEKFLNMADGSGSGKDWCVLIGGDESVARLSSNAMDSPTAIGYYRSFRGESPQKGKIGFGPKDMSEWTGLYYPKWYKCGVDIPGKSRLISLPVPPRSRPTTPRRSMPPSEAPTVTVSTRTTEDPVIAAPNECLQDVNCWLHYNFTYDDNWNDCHGEQYVTRTKFRVGKYVGVVLCSASRYKLYMAESLEEKFLNMADGSGAGEDWCILIGGNESVARLSSNTFDSPTATGYYRSFRGERPRKGKIGYGPKDGSEWTGLYYPTWYECGVDIPGKSRVVSLAVTPQSSPITPIRNATTTTTVATSTTPIPWGDVKFGQVKFTEDRIFIVPKGVTQVDVICIGGGGGGRDGHSTVMVTGDGGESSFGPYVIAGGGKGAKTDDSGGQGGYGSIANGGQGGKGGGCSAGAGAAGQTSGGGHNGLEAGSSTYPFCGGGGSSGGSSCGNIFGSIQPGRSGPGGEEPKGRAGGLYGGGGGSRAGGRAGGGGGYSRAHIIVIPREKIRISVGKAGTPAYWAGKPAQGVVVLSWGGPINATGSFINQLTVSESAPTVTVPTPTTEDPTIAAPHECLQDVNCWLHYNFTYDDNWNDCHGEQYVTRTKFSFGKYVGVVLCSASRYKLFMADSLEEKFLNMADGSGAGEDWCFLIGGDESVARLSSNTFDSPTATGYYRSFRGERPRKGKIGYGPKDGSEWTGLYYPTWYECGVDIPGKSRVVSSAVTPQSSPITTMRSATTTTTAVATATTPIPWDDVKFGQVKFTEDRIFVVPIGVTRVDVICIGGGGGGRDGHATAIVTGDGGNSTFGGYVIAEGGKGAKTDDSGGQGGYGSIAYGGQGGKGGGCSAGAGAAGQTSGGGHNGLEAGSSTYPFCGGGGSSGGSSCGNIFGSIQPGQSGPGGEDPKGRAGGLYGGGGGSRAGGRAGGGGGYSRAHIIVIPREKIHISVGKAGTPAYWSGKPAQGVVVLSWGGPINATGSFINQLTVSESPSPTTAAPPTPTVTTLPRQKCVLWHCSGGYTMKAQCVNGFCECGGSGYNKYTCFPEVGSCLILANQDNALATSGSYSRSDVHSCVGSSENSEYEVHVIALYEPSYSSTVNLRIMGTSKKPMVLVLANYESVMWAIQADPELDVREIKLFSFKPSRVRYGGLTNSSRIAFTESRSPRGRGDDSGGGDTVGLLKLLIDKYGDVASFTGTYRTSSWSLILPRIEGAKTTVASTEKVSEVVSNSTGVEGAKTTAASTEKVSEVISNTTDPYEACLSSTNCWLKYNFTYDHTWTACGGERYVRRIRYSTDIYVGVILCSADRYNLVMANGLKEVFSNIADEDGVGEDVCGLIGSDDKSATLKMEFLVPRLVQRVNTASLSETPQKGEIGQRRKKLFPRWYECGVSIPGNVLVVQFPGNSSDKPLRVNTTSVPTKAAMTATKPTTTTATSYPEFTWDEVPFGQKKFKRDTTFVVPNGVTKVDVICIGGGGGGRDDHVPFTRNQGHGGNGGNSSFGPYLWAEGGKGAKADNSGGEGGFGFTANGGQGGVGGGCSAGAGAAGQTSGGGAGGLEAGSSTYPFCGAGGSSGGTSCGTEFRSIAPGSSGPGGKDPLDRAGGFYGGGGGSRAGARAGGGGGYSRAIIWVIPGEQIEITVGKIGKPFYRSGKPGPGVVVVSWGGPIDPLYG